MAFIDVDSGKHIIDANHSSKYVSKDRATIDVIAGKTYYFRVTQNMRNRIIGYALVVPSTLVDDISSSPFPITPLKEDEAKREIREILKSKELNEVKTSNISVPTEITKPDLPKSTNAFIKEKSSEPSGYGQKLRELKKLKDEGLLSDKEYEQKRKAVVDGI